jgi:hypothetical protein
MACVRRYEQADTGRASHNSYNTGTKTYRSFVLYCTGWTQIHNVPSGQSLYYQAAFFSSLRTKEILSMVSILVLVQVSEASTPSRSLCVSMVCSGASIRATVSAGCPSPDARFLPRREDETGTGTPSHKAPASSRRGRKVASINPVPSTSYTFEALTTAT